MDFDQECPRVNSQEVLGFRTGMRTDNTPTFLGEEDGKELAASLQWDHHVLHAERIHHVHFKCQSSTTCLIYFRNGFL